MVRLDGFSEPPDFRQRGEIRQMIFERVDAARAPELAEHALALFPAAAVQ